MWLALVVVKILFLMWLPFAILGVGVAVYIAFRS